MVVSLSTWNPTCTAWQLEVAAVLFIKKKKEEKKGKGRNLKWRFGKDAAGTVSWACDDP
jgi:hypothetical protein